MRDPVSNLGAFLHAWRHYQLDGHRIRVSANCHASVVENEQAGEGDCWSDFASRRSVNTNISVIH